MEELTALPIPPNWFQGGRFVEGKDRRGGEGRTRWKGSRGVEGRDRENDGRRKGRKMEMDGNRGIWPCLLGG